MEIPVEKIHPSDQNVRKMFSAESLEELTQSIEDHGLIGAPLVRPHPKKRGEYELACGERRWRAARAAGKKTVDCTVREISDSEMIVLSIIENTSREDVPSPYKGQAVLKLKDMLGIAAATQEELAQKIKEAAKLPYSDSTIAHWLVDAGYVEPIRKAATAERHGSIQGLCRVDRAVVSETLKRMGLVKKAEAIRGGGKARGRIAKAQEWTDNVSEKVGTVIVEELVRHKKMIKSSGLKRVAQLLAEVERKPRTEEEAKELVAALVGEVTKERETTKKEKPRHAWKYGVSKDLEGRIKKYASETGRAPNEAVTYLLELALGKEGY